MHFCPGSWIKALRKSVGAIQSESNICWQIVTKSFPIFCLYPSSATGCRAAFHKSQKRNIYYTISSYVLRINVFFFKTSSNKPISAKNYCFTVFFSPCSNGFSILSATSLKNDQNVSKQCKAIMLQSFKNHKTQDGNFWKSLDMMQNFAFGRRYSYQIFKRSSGALALLLCRGR